MEKSTIFYYFFDIFLHFFHYHYTSVAFYQHIDFFAIRTQHLLFCIHNMNYSPHLGLQRSSRSSINALEGFAVT